jgi:superfamily II DNA or RNA helicase
VGLTQLTLRFEYRSHDSVLARDLYARCLPLSTRLDRAVGFFSTSVLAACPQAFHDFFLRRGIVRIVASPILDRRDIEAIVEGYRDRPSLLRTPCLDILAADRAALLRDLPRLVSWLIATGRIDVKIAVLTGTHTQHIYHEKLGIFHDGEGETVTFSGSANETLAGLEANFESVDIFRSWKRDERRRALEKVKNFASLWENETPGVEVYPFPRAAHLGVLLTRTPSQTERPTTEASSGAVPVERMPNIEEFLRSPPEIDLRPHQKSAVRAWFAHDGHGVLAMATGSGKTITALVIATKLYESLAGPMLIVIVCPFLHLASQWIEEADRFGLSPLLCAIQREQWYEPLATLLFNLSSGTRSLASLVVSNATFASPAFQSLLQRAPERTLIIADEVHNLGAETLKTLLPEAARYRVRLSATPERKHDESGTQSIREYFGPPVYEYPLAQALRDGVLCRYFYHPILVQLHDDEFDDYLELTRRIGRLLGEGDDIDTSPVLQGLLIKRARLIATARAKIPGLVQAIGPLKESAHTIVYCGDGSVEGPADPSIMRHIDAVVGVLGKDLGMRVARYVADTPLTRRTKLRQQFRDGIVQALVAIRCLDEGVDIPEIRRAFLLASSTKGPQPPPRGGPVVPTGCAIHRSCRTAATPFRASRPVPTSAHPQDRAHAGKRPKLLSQRQWPMDRC